MFDTPFNRFGFLSGLDSSRAGKTAHTPASGLFTGKTGMGSGEGILFHHPDFKTFFEHKTMNANSIVSKLRSFCTILLDDSVSYGDYLDKTRYGSTTTASTSTIPSKRDRCGSRKQILLT
jgi:hypothetical protein